MIKVMDSGQGHLFYRISNIIGARLLSYHGKAFAPDRIDFSRRDASARVAYMVFDDTKYLEPPQATSGELVDELVDMGYSIARHGGLNELHLTVEFNRSEFTRVLDNISGPVGEYVLDLGGDEGFPYSLYHVFNILFGREAREYGYSIDYAGRDEDVIALLNEMVNMSPFYESSRSRSGYIIASAHIDELHTELMAIESDDSLSMARAIRRSALIPDEVGDKLASQGTR